MLYGTGAIRVNDETGKVERVGGVKYVVKDGIVYDAKKLLADVETLVAKRKRNVRLRPRGAAVSVDASPDRAWRALPALPR